MFGEGLGCLADWKVLRINPFGLRWERVLQWFQDNEQRKGKSQMLQAVESVGIV